jgi:hypothetical protein
MFHVLRSILCDDVNSRTFHKSKIVSRLSKLKQLDICDFKKRKQNKTKSATNPLPEVLKYRKGAEVTNMAISYIGQ